jgi:geranylgeranyl pyrophosphate synthase
MKMEDDLWNRKINKWRTEVRDYLDKTIHQSRLPAPLKEAIAYASTVPVASRWRAILALQVGETLGSDREACFAAATAIEALHCAALAADDLPCMDGAEERRGQATLHRRYNEAVALQTTLWLLGISRTLMIEAVIAAAKDDPHRRLAQSVALVSAKQQTTEDDLQMGQFLDMMGGSGRIATTVEEVARLKCARLFALAALAPACLPLTPQTGKCDRVAVLEEFGQTLGIAYQALDDLDDQQFDENCDTWNDAKGAHRLSFVAEFGRDGVAGKVGQLWQSGVACLRPLAEEGLDVAPLARIASAILKRDALRSDLREEARLI